MSKAKTNSAPKSSAATKVSAKKPAAKVKADPIVALRQTHAEWKAERAIKLGVMVVKAGEGVKKAQAKVDKIAARVAAFEAKAAERLDKILAKHDPKAKMRRKLASYQAKMEVLQAALDSEA